MAKTPQAAGSPNRGARKAHRPPTIHDVAEHAGVSVMTVSRVINHYPTVRARTLQRVHAAIEALGYKQNEAARMLKGQRANTIGLIVPDLSDSFFATCTHIIQHVARQHGFMTIVIATDRDPRQEMKDIHLLAERRVAGLILVTSASSHSHVRALEESGVKVVALGRPLTEVNADMVVSDNRGGAEVAVQHLLEHHHHKRIVCAGYDEAVFGIEERIVGYKRAMKAAKLKPEVAVGLESYELFSDWLKSRMAVKPSPTALFLLNHRTSGFALQATQQLKINVPRELALVGFDDLELAAVLRTPLTVVAQETSEIATRAALALLGRIRAEKSGPKVSVTITLPVKLIRRASCGCQYDGTD